MSDVDDMFINYYDSKKVKRVLTPDGYRHPCVGAIFCLAPVDQDTIAYDSCTCGAFPCNFYHKCGAIEALVFFNGYDVREAYRWLWDRRKGCALQH